MLVVFERRLDISELQFWTETPLYPAEADQGGWIVGNGDGTKWRTWGAMGPEWTTDRNTATRYYRREDAEAVHRDDEDAWTIVPFSDQGPQASTEAAWCDDTLPCARYTEAADRIIVLEADVARLREFIANPPKHNFWGAGEPDCPRELKAGNGELHTLRCKVCGLDSPKDDVCRAQMEVDHAE
jgi:hypothetical protein